MATAEHAIISRPKRPKAMSAVMTRRISSASRPGSGRPRRPYSAYTRRDEEQGAIAQYDQPNSNREWWRYYLRDTPTPGSYQISDFVADLHKRSASYGFRDTSRSKRPIDLQRKGNLLLPGAYEHKDFLEESAKKLQTFGFRAVDRQNATKIGHSYGDKEIETTPNQYNVVDYSEGPKKNDVKSSAFKSVVKRDLECAQFRIVQGPGPGRYDDFKSKSDTGPSSTFKSRVSRFGGKASKVPGPGSYSIGCEQPPPLPAVVAHMSNKHGIKMI